MNAKLGTMRLLRQYINIKGSNKFQDQNFSWKKGSVTANNDIIICKWNKETWIRLASIESFETNYSDHKAFRLEILVNENIVPNNTNDRWIID